VVRTGAAVVAAAVASAGHVLPGRSQQKAFLAGGQTCCHAAGTALQSKRGGLVGTQLAFAAVLRWPPGLSGWSGCSIKALAKTWLRREPPGSPFSWTIASAPQQAPRSSVARRPQNSGQRQRAAAGCASPISGMACDDILLPLADGRRVSSGCCECWLLMAGVCDWKFCPKACAC